MSMILSDMNDPDMSFLSENTNKKKKEYEYLVVTDKTSEVIISTTDRFEAVKLANKIRKAGGEVTVFRSTDM